MGENRITLEELRKHMHKVGTTSEEVVKNERIEKILPTFEDKDKDNLDDHGH